MAASFSPCCAHYATSVTAKGPVLAESDLILLHDNIFQHYFTCYLKPWSHWAEFIYSWQETKSSVSIPLNSVISYVKGTHLLWGTLVCKSAWLFCNESVRLPAGDIVFLVVHRWVMPTVCQQQVKQKEAGLHSVITL